MGRCLVSTGSYAVRKQTVSISRFLAMSVSVATTELCQPSSKAAADNRQRC